jgi:hypothetical protein
VYKQLLKTDMKRKGGPKKSTKEDGKPLKKKMGAPRKEIDTEKLYALAQTLLPVETIAIVLGCNPDTIYANFSDILQMGRQNRKTSLSQVMWHAALVDKDTKMMIWLSKQHLGYKDTMPEQAAQVIFNVSINEVP